MDVLKTYIIGRGNLGSHIANLFREHDFDFKIINISELSLVDQNSLVWLCIPDSAIGELIEKLIPSGCLMIYASGAINIQEKWKSQVGVWYPLYSFRKGYDLEWKEVPVFTESYTKPITLYLKLLNSKLGINAKKLDSKKRLKLHLAAVFVNNFTNALLNAAEESLSDFTRDEVINALLPIAKQTINRWPAANASELQTGPAVRGDNDTIMRHLAQLSNLPEESELYASLTKYIAQKIKQNAKKSNKSV